MPSIQHRHLADVHVARAKDDPKGFVSTGCEVLSESWLIKESTTADKNWQALELFTSVFQVQRVSIVVVP